MEVASAHAIPQYAIVDASVRRRSALSRLHTWLRESDDPLGLVIGPPGAGKTVLAAQLIETVSADATAPVLVLAHFCDAITERTLLPLEFVADLSNRLAALIPGFEESRQAALRREGIVINVHGEVDVGEVHAGGVAAAVVLTAPQGIAPRQAFHELVRRPLQDAVGTGWRDQLLVVVDDLSAGADRDGAATILELLSHVAEQRTARELPLRFVATSRATAAVLRSLPAPVVDLRSVDPGDRDELATLVSHELADGARPVAAALIARIVDAAEGNFLYAHAIAGGLRERPDDAVASLPADLDELYDDWLKRTIRHDSEFWYSALQRVLTVLTAARGGGLTRVELAACTELTRGQAARAVDVLSPFLRMAGDRDPVRLFHDSLREHLEERNDIDTDEGHADIVRTLTSQFSFDWLQASSYAREHLAGHAARTGDLAALVERVDFLVAAEPIGLLTALRGAGPDVRDSPGVIVYRSAAWRFPELDAGERAAYLSLAAQTAGVPAVAEPVQVLSLSRPWRVRWTAFVYHNPGFVLGNHPGGVADLLDGAFDELFSIGKQGTLRYWDLSSQTMSWELPFDGWAPNGRLAWTDVDGRDLLVVLRRHLLTFVDPTVPGAVAELTVERSAPACALATVMRDAKRYAVIGYSDGAARVMEVPSGRIVGEVKLHDGPVLTLWSTGIDVVSSGADGRVMYIDFDDMSVGELYAPDEPRVWTGAVATAETEAVYATMIGTANGMVDVTRTDHADRFDSVADALHDSSHLQSSIALMSKDGDHLTVTMHRGGTPTFAEQVDRLPLSASQEEIYGVGGRSTVRVFGGVDSVDAVAAGDRALFASGGTDGRVIVYGVEAAGDIDAFTLHPAGAPITRVRFAQLNDAGRAVVAGSWGEPGRIRFWPMNVPDAVAFTRVGTFAQPLDVADVSDEHIALGFRDDGVTVLDAESGGSVIEMEDAGLVLSGVALQRGPGGSWLAFGASRESETPAGRLRVWDEATGQVVDCALDSVTSVTAAAFVREGRIVLAGWDERSDSGSIWIAERRESGWSVDRMISGIDRSDALEAAPGTEIVIAYEGDQIGVLHLDRTVGTRFLARSIVAPSSFVREGMVHVVTVDDDGIHVHRLEDDDGDDVFEELDLHPGTARGSVRCLATAVDGSILAAGTEDGRVHIWRDAVPGRQTIEIGSPIRGIAVVGIDVIARTDLGLCALSLT